MVLFISYSSRDHAAIEKVTTALRRAHLQTWLDEELSGGEAWWNAILKQIRDCEVFIAALSKNYLESKPCQAELRYAQELHRPILPVQIGPVDSMRVNPLAAVQCIDYQNPTIDTGIELIAAVHARTVKAEPLPSPLPEPPPVPFAYLMRLNTTIAAPNLSAQEQAQLLSELKSGLDTDGHEPSARRDLTQLLIMLRDRPDVTWRTRTDAESALAAVAAIVAAVLLVIPKPTPLPPPKPIPLFSGPLNSLPLTPDEINHIMGAADMRPTDFAQELNDVPGIFSKANCRGALYNAQKSIYAGSGYSAVRRQILTQHASNTGSQFFVTQTAIIFPSADKAHGFLKTTADTWNDCAGQTVTYIDADDEVRWSLGGVTGIDPKIEQLATQEAASGRGCQHVMSTVSNVIIEVTACADQINDQAGQIVDKMVAKVTQ